MNVTTLDFSCNFLIIHPRTRFLSFSFIISLEFNSITHLFYSIFNWITVDITCYFFSSIFFFFFWFLFKYRIKNDQKISAINYWTWFWLEHRIDLAEIEIEIYNTNVVINFNNHTRIAASDFWFFQLLSFFTIFFFLIFVPTVLSILYILILIGRLFTSIF